LGGAAEVLALAAAGVAAAAGNNKRASSLLEGHITSRGDRRSTSALGPVF
jgi:hypothetical protein